MTSSLRIRLASLALLSGLAACGEETASAPVVDASAPAASDAVARVDAVVPDAIPESSGTVVASLATEPVAPQVAGADPSSADETPAPQDAATPVRPPVNTGTAIPDIMEHRVEPLSYVRRLDDVVTLDLSGLDLEADVILTVGDHPVTRNDFRRRMLMYTSMNEIEKYITRVLTLQQIEENVAAGADPAAFELAEEELDLKVTELKELVRTQAEMQNSDPDEAVAELEASIESSIGWDAYRQLLGADALFEKVFLPMPTEPIEGAEPYDPALAQTPADMPRPDWCPKVTWDALGANEQGRGLRVFVHNYAVAGEPIPALFKAQVLNQLREGLLAAVGVAYFFDEDLPDDVMLRVGDQNITIQELWVTMDRTVSNTDIELALREELTMLGMRRNLEANERWLDDAAFEEKWREHEAEYAGTLFPLRHIIVFRGYMSLDRYREHYRYRVSFDEWRKAELTDDELLAHYQTGGRLFFEQGHMRADLAFSPLPTGENGQPIFTEEAFAEAEAKLAAAISEYGDDWDRVVAEFPPPPVNKPQGDGKTYQRSPYRMRAAESELSILMTGYSLVDDMFYHGLPGEIVGPFAQRCRRHSWGAEANAGVWAGKVLQFSRRAPLGPLEGNVRDLCIGDYLDLNYLYWAQECLASVLADI